MLKNIFITTIEYNGEEVFVFQESGKTEWTFLKKKEGRYCSISEEDNRLLQHFFRKRKICRSKNALKKRLQILTFGLITAIASNGHLEISANHYENANTTIEKEIENIDLDNIQDDKILEIVKKIAEENIIPTKGKNKAENVKEKSQQEIDFETLQEMATVTNKQKDRKIIETIEDRKIIETIEDCEKLIETYNLEEEKEEIFNHIEEFCKYYNTIIGNEKITANVLSVLLKDFSFFQKMGILDRIQKRLSELTIQNNVLECMMSGAYGVYYEDQVYYYMYGIPDEVKAHELYHAYAQLYEAGDMLYADGEFYKMRENDSIKNAKIAKIIHIVSFGCLDEAIAEDIASTRYGIKQYASVYEDICDLLQSFYVMFGKEEMVKAYLAGNLGSFMIENLKPYLSDREIIQMCANLEILHTYTMEGIYSLIPENGTIDFQTEKEDIWKANINIKRTKTAIVDALLKLYEKKTKNRWQDSVELKTSLEAFVSQDIQYDYYQDLSYDSNFYSQYTPSVEIVPMNREYYNYVKQNQYVSSIGHASFFPDDHISQVKYLPENEEVDFKVLFENGKELWYKDGDIIRYYYGDYESKEYGFYETASYQKIIVK